MKQTILFADGDTELCDLYKPLLTMHGYEVETSSNEVDCLAKLQQFPPAVIVLDLHLLRGGDGLLGWLRDEWVGQDVPVIVTHTAGYSPQILKLAVLASLCKPYTLARLLDSLRLAISLTPREPSAPMRRVQMSSELYIG